MERARRLGVRPADAKLPPPDGLVTEDQLQLLREIVQQLGEDVDRHESTTEEQRQIMRLKAQLKALVAHNNTLVDSLKDHETRLAHLEAIAAGRREP
jgi:GAF domain-containing protein